MMKVAMTTGALRRASSYQIVTINKPTTNFYTCWMPFLSPNDIKALKGKSITFHGLAYPKLIQGLPTLSSTTKGSWLHWERVAKPLSAL